MRDTHIWSVRVNKMIDIYVLMLRVFSLVSSHLNLLLAWSNLNLGLGPAGICFLCSSHYVSQCYSQPHSLNNRGLTAFYHCRALDSSQILTICGGNRWQNYFIILFSCCLRALCYVLFKKLSPEDSQSDIFLFVVGVCGGLGNLYSLPLHIYL